MYAYCAIGNHSESVAFYLVLQRVDSNITSVIIKVTCLFINSLFILSTLYTCQGMIDCGWHRICTHQPSRLDWVRVWEAFYVSTYLFEVRTSTWFAAWLLPKSLELVKRQCRMQYKYSEPCCQYVTSINTSHPLTLSGFIIASNKWF